LAIAHEASSGIEGSTSAKGSTSTTVAYTGVAFGRMALLFVTVKLGTSTWNTVPGWTILVDQSGGTGTSAADAGTTRLGVWYRELLGTETGNVTITNTGGESSGGGMSVYSKTNGNTWVTPIATHGDDTGHGTNRSCVCSAWGSALATNDFVVLAWASDTDSTSAVSAPTITQASATFDTVNMRNKRLSSSGNDCGLYSADCSVTTGNANAPTIGFTLAVSQCGRGAAIRLREASPVAGKSIKRRQPKGLVIR
jgi:hypothetical protein